MDLTSIQVLSHLHPGSKIRISLPCMLHLIFIQVPTKQNQGPNIFISPSSMLDLATIWVPSIAFPSRSHPTYIQVSRCVSPPSRPCLTSTQVPIFTPHLHPGHIPTPIQIKKIAYQFHPGPISLPAKTIQFTSHLHIHSAKCISVSSRSHLIPSRPQGLCLTSIKAPSHSHPYRKICISPASRFHLICIQVPRFASHLHLCHVSPLVSSPGLQLTCIQVPSHSLQVPKFVSHLHPVHASSPSRSRYSCHIFIQVTSCLHPGPDQSPKNGISAPSKSHLSSPRTRDHCFTSIQVPLHPN